MAIGLLVGVELELVDKVFCRVLLLPVALLELRLNLVELGTSLEQLAKSLLRIAAPVLLMILCLLELKFFQVLVVSKATSNQEECVISKDTNVDLLKTRRFICSIDDATKAALTQINSFKVKLL